MKMNGRRMIYSNIWIKKKWMQLHYVAVAVVIYAADIFSMVKSKLKFNQLASK